MAATGVINAQNRLVLEEIKEILEDLNPEAAEGLNHFMPNRTMPSPDRRPAEYRLFLAEAVLILAKEAKRRRGGRPKNVTWHSEAGEGEAEKAS